ncbi:MAG: phosphatase PAP2 family protein [Ilumatobacter sp.]|uniref:phosphatase PAP2 family protein n=1 Tax=Ilumatobacter sp. TaxID=1967498 RepID=UPI003C733A62
MTTDTSPTRSLDESGAGDDESWWATTWPLEKADWLRLVVGLVSVVAVFVAVGELLTNWSVLDGIVRTDTDLAQRLADGRTDTQTDLAHWSAFIANTPVKIGASVIIAGFFLWKFRRWHEAVMIGLPLIFEAIVYIVTSHIVRRPRPEVERLLESPVDASFPSGHVAAATVYAALVVIVFWHTRAIWARTLAVIVAVVVSVAVAWARAYQGMHFLSDVIAGMVLGVISIVICARILGSPPDAATDGTVIGVASTESSEARS